MKEKKRASGIMEYVIVAILVILAVVVGVWYFGKDIMNMFGTAGCAAIGGDCSATCQKAAACREGRAAATEAWKAKNDSSSWKHGSLADDVEDERKTTPRDSMVKPVPIPDDGGTTPSEEFKH